MLGTYCVAEACNIENLAGLGIPYVVKIWQRSDGSMDDGDATH